MRLRKAHPAADQTPPTPGGADVGLDVRELCVDRGASRIIREVSLVAPPAAVTVVLGSNGAGKTTLLEALSGVISCAGGSIDLHGRAITSFGRRNRALAGLGHVEQGRQVFGELTTEENLRAVALDEEAAEGGFAMFPELEQRRHVAAGMLSGGEQQMLVLARALARSPRILMVDEMSLGLAPKITQRLIEAMRRLADERGVGVLLIEQYASLALGIGDHAYVLGQGTMVYDGDCQTLIDEPELLRRAYLGHRVTGESAATTPDTSTSAATASSRPSAAGPVKP
jgi:branched-chain amino acid transport system ATP-binding protein